MKNAAIAIVGFAYMAVVASTLGAAQAPAGGPRYAAGMNLVRPIDYREWTFISSGLGMTYKDPSTAPEQTQAGPPTFGNVFVTPSSYRSFLQTGKWPDKTVFVLELRTSGSDASINKAGRFQSDLLSVEAEVKDARFPDGWAFFNFGRAAALNDSAEPLPVSAGCVECHTAHSAVERTFVQFYPTLMDVARRKGTVKPGY
jgi:hypothetical protein